MTNTLFDNQNLNNFAVCLIYDDADIDVSHNIMDEFSKKSMDYVRNPRYHFYEILINGKSPYKEFTESLNQKKDKKAIEALHAIMDRFGDTLLNSTIVNHISGGKYDRKDVYEFKKNNIRIYFILQRPDVMILLGGFKVNQVNDIATIFRKFNSLPLDIPDYE